MSGNPGLPIVMALSSLLPVIRNLKADAVRITKECGPVVRCVLGVVLGLGRLDTERAQLAGDSDHIFYRFDTKAEVMQPRRVWIVRIAIASRADGKAKVAVEILDVGVSTEGEPALAKAKRISENEIVEDLRAG